MSIIGKLVVIENINTSPYKSWVMCGLPEAVPEQHLVARHSQLGAFPAYAIGHCLYVNASMPAARRGTFTIETGPTPTQPNFIFSDWVTDEIIKIIPKFKIRSGSDVYTSNPIDPHTNAIDFIKVIEQNYARMVFHFRTRILQANMTIEGWLYVHNDQPAIEYEINATYGTTQLGQARDRTFGSLSMVVGEIPVVDFKVPKGLHDPMWYSDTANGGIVWEAELATPNQWMRARTVEVFGALLCLPPIHKLSQVISDPRITNLLSRLQAPLTSIYTDWDSKYGPIGQVPRSFPDLAAQQVSRRSRLNSRLLTPGNEYDPREYGQPPNSGQTGEQADFGIARAEAAIIMKEPWALWDLRYHVQAWKLRPYANREPDGSPVLAINHPKTKTYNLRPDERFSRDDMLGWPNPVGWISGYTTSDSQHRSDNLLIDLYMLTRSKSLERTIRDILELERMQYEGGEPPVGSGMGAPRGWGRVLYARCKAYSAGFTEFEPLIRKMVASAYRVASYRRLSPDVKVRVLSDDEEKYGWLDQNSDPIRCWLPWQESIAVIGFYAAWKVLGIPEARELAVVASKTIASYAFFKAGTQWYTAYGVRWRTDVEGEPLPPSAYHLDIPNNDVFVYGMHRWTLPALRILEKLEPTAPENVQGRQILNFFGEAKNFDEACWWAI